MWRESIKRSSERHKIRPSEQGMALMVSMVLIFLMSVLGISAMRTATLEGRMVSNSFQKELTLQAAESASDEIISNDVIIEKSICTSGKQITPMDKLNAEAVLDTEGYITFGGSTVVLNYSLDGGFGAVKFIAGGESNLANTSTRSEISQGLYLIGPAQLAAGCS